MRTFNIYFPPIVLWTSFLILLLFPHACSRRYCSCRCGETMSLNCGHQRVIFYPPDIWVWRATVEWYRGKRKPRRKTCPIATFSTTNRPWTYLGANTSLRCERLATARPFHMLALKYFKIITSYIYRCLYALCSTLPWRRTLCGSGGVACHILNLVSLLDEVSGSSFPSTVVIALVT
jgi:hypothetical protein